MRRIKFNFYVCDPAIKEFTKREQKPDNYFKDKLWSRFPHLFLDENPCQG